jgi:AcrR family transcriptional regulator
VTARKPGRPANKQPVVSPEDITRHALALLDQEGASGLSLRKIAAAMGVTPMALYRYVDGRSALVASLLDSILAPVQLPPEGGSPLAALTEFLEAYGAAVTRHPHVFISFFSQQEARSAEAQRITAELTGLLEQTGLSPQEAQMTRDILVDHAHGHAISIALARAGADPTADYRGTIRFLLGRLIRG